MKYPFLAQSAGHESRLLNFMVVDKIGIELGVEQRKFYELFLCLLSPSAYFDVAVEATDGHFDRRATIPVTVEATVWHVIIHENK